jgi:hypothetical protein
VSPLRFPPPTGADSPRPRLEGHYQLSHRLTPIDQHFYVKPLFGTMYPLLRKQCGLKASRLGSMVQARALATVQTTAPPRRNQLIRPQGTPVSRERATLTIKDGPIFHGKSFGAKATVSGEAVFTTSLVGYPESVRLPSLCCRGMLTPCHRCQTHRTADRSSSSRSRLSATTASRRSCETSMVCCGTLNRTTSKPVASLFRTRQSSIATGRLSKVWPNGVLARLVF